MRWLPLLLLTGCALDDNYLDGSLSQVLDLHFTHTRVRLYDSEVSVEYVDQDRFGIVALRMTVDNDGLGNDQPYDLVENGDVGASDELDAQLPPMSEGEVEFFRGFDEGDPVVSGRFDARFRSEDGTTLGVVGRFSAEPEEVEF